MKISVFGLGYVGCVGLGCLARNGNKVIGIDINKSKVDLINNGKATIFEKGIDEIIKEQRNMNNISATTSYIDAVIQTDISIICVGTPTSNTGHLNLNHIYNTADQIGEAIKEKKTFHTIVIRSTVSPGTNAKVAEIISKKSKKVINLDFGVVSNPEFLREGTAVDDYLNPAITVLGSDSKRSLKIMKEVYSNINAPIIITEVGVAEMIKYINNAFHALKITFANEVGNICKELDIDSHKLMDVFCMDDQLNISSYYFKPGFSYGGSCLPKDLKALQTLSHDKYLNSPILEAIELSNDNQKKIVKKMIDETGKKKIGIIGISFKDGTDDLRNSPTVDIVVYLLEKGYDIKIWDPNVDPLKLIGTNKNYLQKHIPHLSEYITDDMAYVINCSEVILITQQNEDIIKIAKDNTDLIIIDLIRILKKRSNNNYRGICW